VAVPKGTPPGPYTIDVQGRNQGRTVSTRLTVNVVEDPPTAQPPIMSLMPGVQLGRTSVKVRVVWPPASDPTSPIGGYQVQKTTDGVTWTSTISLGATRHETTYTLALDTNYRFRVRAVDTAGNWSPWALELAQTRLHPYDDRSSVVVHGGTWARTTAASAWRETLSGSSRSSTSLGMAFTGHSVAVVGPRNPWRGKAKVYVDGVYIRTIDMRTSSSTSRQVVFTRYFPRGGWHTIKVVPVATAAHLVFRLDAFVVSR
jgi:hypothetical protein